MNTRITHGLTVIFVVSLLLAGCDSDEWFGDMLSTVSTSAEAAMDTDSMITADVECTCSHGACNSSRG